MSSFATKRKGKAIVVQDDEASTSDTPLGTDATATDGDTTKLFFTPKAARKPLRQSGLRKAFSAADENDRIATSTKSDDDDEDTGPVVVRPGSLKSKRKSAKSRLSFQGGADNDEDNGATTPRKTGLGKRALENNAVKRAVSMRSMPTRGLKEDESDRPKYSKEYLDELQSSTPSTPRDISTLHISDPDEMILDSSELDGALVVDYFDKQPSDPATQILSEAQIREKKERRARLAQEENFLSVEEDEIDVLDDEKKETGRLIAEDEDLGEGYDEYVEDGGLSLGKRANQARRRQQRQQMAELITAAEGQGSEDSSDSEAEGRMAYEAAQSKAGLDGLEKPQMDPSEGKMPSKITPLPHLSDCLARFQATLKHMEHDLDAKRARLKVARENREAIDRRKQEVQSLLDEMGQRYKEAMASGKAHTASISQAGSSTILAGERGLDSLGTMPQRSEADEMDDGS